MNNEIIVANNFSVSIDDRAILHNINFAIEAGAFTAVVGPNGSGKSTLLKAILGLLPSSEGQLRVFDLPPEKAPSKWIGYVPQLKSFDRSFPGLAIELVTTGILGHWVWSLNNKLKESALEALNHVGAEHLAFRQIGKLSGGELQRVYLARALIRKPKLVLLDEPATGIDVSGEADMYHLLENYHQTNNATVLMVTHDWSGAFHHFNKALIINREQISFGATNEALSDENLRTAFGHIGHKHEMRMEAPRDD